MEKENKNSKIKKLKDKKLPWIILVIISAVIGVLRGINGVEINMPLDRILLLMGILFVTFIITFMIHVILHEGGHLIFGLLSGYKFVSFRVGNLTLVKEDDKFAIKKFKIAGTAGQCLMMPGSDNYKECSYVLYNLGGIIMNLITSILCFVIYTFIPTNGYIKVVLFTMAVVGLLIFVTNGIPMKIGGIANDGYNLISIMKDDLMKYCMHTKLKVNGLLSSGMRIKDMPTTWFELDEKCDYSNPLITSLKCMEANYYTDKRDFNKAKECCEFLLNYNPKIISLYEKELQCDLLFYEIIGNKDENKINKLYTKQLQKYIKATDCYISRKRLMYAYHLFIEKDLKKCEQILKEVEKLKKTYPIKAEIESEVELIDYVKKLQVAQ